MSSDALAWVAERQALCRQATDGPWLLMDDTDVLAANGTPEARIVAGTNFWSREPTEPECIDARHIAAHDPATMRLVWAVIAAAANDGDAGSELRDALAALWAHVLGAAE